MTDEAGVMAIIIVATIILALVVLLIVSMWKLYEKAGQPGWAAIVPIYNTIVQLDIVGKPRWWVLLMLIPYVSIIWVIWVTNLFVKKFGKDEGWTAGCIFLPFIFYPIMAFSDDIQFIGGDNEEDKFMDERNRDLLDQI